MLVSLDGLPPAATTIELYAKFGAPPTRADYQYAVGDPGIDQPRTCSFPMAAPGTWYILVYAENVAAPPETYTLTATVSPVTLTAVSPNLLGNAEDAVLTLTGAGFDATTTVSLVAANGTTYQANQVQLDLPTQLSATFTAGCRSRRRLLRRGDARRRGLGHAAATPSPWIRGASFISRPIWWCRAPWATTSRPRSTCNTATRAIWRCRRRSSR